jgi:streptomycin 6-kinase
MDQISARLGLCDLTPVLKLSYNYVLSGFKEDRPIILKLGMDIEALALEAFALKCFEGRGAVKLLAADEGFLLLERAISGISLKSYFPDNDPEAVKIACKVMKKLAYAKIPDHHNFPHIKDWLSALDKEWDLPSGYLSKARKLRDQLLKATKQDVLLHGDLHLDNILQNGKDWMVIDPKGVIGSSLNEVWSFAIDIERDIPFIAEYFGFRVQDLFDWYFVHAILATCWNLEDNIDPSLFLNLAKKSYSYVS